MLSYSLERQVNVWLRLKIRAKDRIKKVKLLIVGLKSQATKKNYKWNNQANVQKF